MLVLLAFLAAVLSPGWDFTQAVLSLEGVDDISEVDSFQLEHWEGLSQHPARINFLSARALVSTGLFSSYQAASILDWRRRVGDIASIAELGAVDGFTPLLCRILEGFVSFETSESGPSPAERPAVEASAGIAASASVGKISWQYMGKAKLQWNLPGREGASAGEMQLSLATKSSWANPPSAPQSVGWSVSWNSARIPIQVVAGYFSARFGQGLLQWNGLSIDSYSSPASLMKHPTGIVPYTSWSTSYAKEGIAVNASLSRLGVSAYADPFSRNALCNLSYCHRNGSIGLSAVCDWSAAASVSAASGEDSSVSAASGESTSVSAASGESTFLSPTSSPPLQAGVSADFQQTVGGVVLFGEAAFRPGQGESQGGEGNSAGLLRSGLSVLVGTRFRLLETDFSLRSSADSAVRNACVAAAWMSPSRIHAVSGGVSFTYYALKKGQAPAHSGDLKASLQHTAALPSGLSFKTAVKLRLRPFGDGPGQELREDVTNVFNTKLTATLRLSAAHCREWGLLCGADIVWKPSEAFSLSAQGGVFRIDNWADRIYVYQRDAPGMFNSVAMYGRGFWTNVCARWSPCKALRLYARAYLVSYPWARSTDTHTASSASARLHCVVDF